MRYPALSTSTVRPERDFVPRRLLLQWHITERCNLRCTHCYRSDSRQPPDLTFADLSKILAQFLELLDACECKLRQAVSAQVTVTGGEPFIREDFLDLLDMLAVHRQRLEIGILTNGTLLDGRLARFLGILRPKFVQLSLDGLRETHDHLRGPGNFARVCEAARLLRRQRVPVMISFTANRLNFRELPALAETVRTLGVDMFWSDRFIPLGQSQAARELVLSPADTREFVSLLAAEANKTFWRGRRTRIAAHRALQFLGNGLAPESPPYRCSAAATLLTVMANGSLVPCRRMPVSAGNLLHESMAELYWKHPLFQSMRREQSIAGCEECGHRARCRGGLRCLAHAMHGDSSYADPGCWLARRPVF